MIAPLPKTVVSHLIAESKLIDLDDDIDSGSDYDRYELSLGKGGCNNPRHVHIEIKLMTKSSAGRDESSVQHHESVSEFEDSYGKIPDLIFYSSVSDTKSELATIIRTKT